jgi:cobalt-zinc-cadmium efflux system protein
VSHDHDHGHHGHGHHHGHGAHGHHHHHGAPSARGFALALVLNGGFVVVELVYGLLDSSMALVADALHNLGDVAGIALGWGAVMLARRRPTAQRTYGWRKATVLAALANAMLLLLTVGAVAWEATHRLWSPQPVPGLTLVVVAAIGVAINGVSALAFMGGEGEHDVNRRAAFLHLLADAGVSLGVVVAGAMMMTTKWWWLDPATGLVVSVVILATTWSLLREALAQAMDAVPRHVDASAVRHHLEALPGVQEVHDLHIWPLATTEVALTVHLVIPAGRHDPSLLARLSGELREEFGIGHSTIQVETPETRDECTRAVGGCV